MTKVAAASDGPLAGLSVLLAEDNVTNQLVASQMLRRLGAEVEIAADGALALDLLKEREFDLLLIDIEMPRVSGLDVIRSVRGGPGPLSEAPIIALTAYAMEEHKAKILDVGADGLIPKPILSIAQFGADIAENLRQARSKRGARTPVLVEPAPQAEVETAEIVMARERKVDGAGAHIERMVYDGLAESIGPRKLPDVLRRASEDLARARDRVETAAESGDMVLMRDASHVLISVAGAIGASRLQKQAEALNRLAHIDQADLAATLSRDLTTELNGVLDFVREERARMEK